LFGARGEAMRTRDGRARAGAAAAAGLAFGGEPRPLAVLALLGAGGGDADCWDLVNTDEVRPFPESWAERIRDGRPLGADALEVKTFGQLLGMVYWTSPAALNKAARDDLTFRQFFERPEKYRGQIVRVTGRLRRLTYDDEPPEPAREAGVRAVYEGWLFSDALGPNPLCLQLPELPPGLEVRQNMDVRVTFAGYFFKKHRYKSADTKKDNEWRDAPLLVGRVVTVYPQARAGDSWGSPLILSFLGLLGVTAAFVAALTWWFRRDDRRVRRRLADLAPAPPGFDEADLGG
jgi:hypothetical protein